MKRLVFCICSLFCTISRAFSEENPLDIPPSEVLFYQKEFFVETYPFLQEALFLFESKEFFSQKPFPYVKEKNQLANIVHEPLAFEEAFVTILESGTLSVSRDSSLGKFPLVLQGGVLKTLASFSSKKPIIVSTNGTLHTNEETTFSLNGPIQGSGLLIKKGKGSLFLTHKNSYKGGTEIHEGSLILEKADVLGSGPVFLQGGNIHSKKSFTLAKEISVEKTSGISVDSGVDFTLQGSLKGKGFLQKKGPGKLRLEAVNHFDGTIDFLEGIISVKNAKSFGKSSLRFDEGSLELCGSFDLNQEITMKSSGSFIVPKEEKVCIKSSINGPGNLLKKGPGSISFSTPQKYTGNTLIQEGTIELIKDSSLKSDSLVFLGGNVFVDGDCSLKSHVLFAKKGAIQISEKGNLSIEGNIRGHSLLIKKGKGSLKLQGENSLKKGIFLKEGNLYFEKANNLGTSPIYFPQNNRGRLAATKSVSIVNPIFFEDKGCIVSEKGGSFHLKGELLGKGNLCKQGKGSLTLSKNPLFEGNIELQQGSLELTDEESIGKGSLIFPENSSAMLVANQSFTLTNSIISDELATISILDGVEVQYKGSFLGKGSLAKKGKGRLFLSGKNQLEGNTLIQEGFLSIEKDLTLGKGTIIVENGGLHTKEGIEVTKPIYITQDGYLFPDEHSIMIVKKPVHGEGHLHKLGSGTLVLETANSYQGNTYLTDGNLLITHQNHLGEGGIYFQGGELAIFEDGTVDKQLFLEKEAKITIPSHTKVTWKGPFQGKGSLWKKGAGKLTLKGEKTLPKSSTLFIQEGTLCIDSETSDFSSPIAFLDGTFETIKPMVLSQEIRVQKKAVFSSKQEGSIYINHPIKGMGDVEKTGEGSMTFAKKNDFRGNFFLREGSVFLKEEGDFGLGEIFVKKGNIHIDRPFFTKQNLFLDSGHTEISVGESQKAVIEGRVSGKGALRKKGLGSLVLRQSNGCKQGTKLYEGTLVLSHPESLGVEKMDVHGGSLKVTTKIASNTPIFLHSSDAIIDVAKDTSLTLFSSLEGKGSIQKKGKGLLFLSNISSFQGDILVTEGSFVLNKSTFSEASLLDSTFSVKKGGYLGGDGQFGSTMIDGGVLYGNGNYERLSIVAGQIAPGNSIGIITVSGNYTQASASSYELEIENNTSDQIIASGSATIDTGAILNIVSIDGTIIKGQTYDILEASGGINQLWTEINNSSNLPVSVSLVDSNTVARLTLLRSVYFRSRNIGSGNASSLRDYLNEFEIPSSTLLNSIQIASSLSDADLKNTLIGWTPALFGAFSWNYLDSIDEVFSTIDQRSLVQRCRKKRCAPSKNGRSQNFWISPTYLSTSAEIRENIPSYKTSSPSIFTGYDACVFDQAILGAFFGYQYTDISWKSVNSQASLQNVFTSLYFSFERSLISLNTSLLGGMHFFHTNRAIEYSSVSETAKNRHLAGSFASHLSLSCQLVPDIFLFFADASYGFLKEQEIEESNSPSFDLCIEGKNSHMLLTKFGTKVLYDWTYGSICTRLFGSMSWVFKTPLGNTSFSSEFRELKNGQKFETETSSQAVHFFSPELGISFDREFFQVSLGYRNEISRNYWLSSVQLSLSGEF